MSGSTILWLVTDAMSDSWRHGQSVEVEEHDSRKSKFMFSRESRCLVGTGPIPEPLLRGAWTASYSGGVFL